MIKVLVGDLFSSRAQTLVNTVNCVGVMGKGIALAFKEKFPEMFRDYERRCKQGEVKLGQPYIFKSLMPPFVLNFPTKDHWRGVSTLNDIVAGIDYLAAHFREWGIESLAVPPLGCGNGQLDWRVVGPTLYKRLARLGIPVELYAPAGTPANQLTPEFLAGQDAAVVGATDGPAAPTQIPASWVALVAILERVCREPYHWPIGRTSFQKIAYFATELGIPTDIRHHRGSYGPFAAELKPMVTRLVNNGLLTETRLGRMLAVAPGPTFGDAMQRYRDKLTEWEPIISRVADLFARMRTDDAEIAASVHFSARQLHSKPGAKPSEIEVLEAVNRWKQKRRPPLDEGEVAEAIRHLNILGLVDLAVSPNLPVKADAF